MDTQKIVDALEDLRSKRSILDQAIRSLESALTVMQGSAETVEFVVHASSAPLRRQRRQAKSSNMDHAIDVLGSVEQMHIQELAERVSKLAGHPVSRGSLDGGISREIRVNNGSSRFDRVSPGTYKLSNRGATILRQRSV